MSRTKDGMMAANEDRTALLKGGWQPPRAPTQDALDLAIQDWMKATGEDGSTARYSIAKLVGKQLAYISQEPETAFVARELEPKKQRRNVCVVCHTNFVDNEAGFDTCEDCVRRV